jgi:hypothetical protein
MLLESCKKKDTCPEDSHCPYYVTASDKARIPYRTDGLDTLIYTSNTGDTALLLGTGIKNDFAYHIYEQSMVCQSVDYNDYEIIFFTFKGSHPDLPSLTCHYQYSFFTPQGQGYIARSFCKYPVQRGNSYRYDTDNLNDTTLYSDSLILNGSLYRGTTIVGRGPEANIRDGSLTILYNSKYGVLRIKTHNQTWTLKL